MMLKRNRSFWFSVSSAVFFGAVVCGPVRGYAQTGASLSLYQTNFEFSEGFDPGFSLVGQGGWVGSDTGGNGLVAGFFEDHNQHAFLGFTLPLVKDTAFLNVWKPISFIPSATQSTVQFSVRMQIVPSTDGHFDDFRWSFYNTAAERLFTIDFDTTALQISYSLDKPTDFTSTGLGFDTLGFYDLEVWMDFTRNLWSATVNDVVIVNSKPITATGAVLTLGDINAVWAVRQPGTPGNNYMVFDDYSISVTNDSSIPPRVEQLGIGTNRAFILRVFGEEGLNYAVEATADGLQWETVRTFKAPTGGVFDFEDADALRTPIRFFRARHVL
ncbi:MAG: hypothetical protein L0Z50_07155 [Verrucomicrobiales bacterium]|nr:hypothetical protein [Verrucomicrobiales bacterium]